MPLLASTSLLELRFYPFKAITTTQACFSDYINSKTSPENVTVLVRKFDGARGRSGKYLGGNEFETTSARDLT